MPAAAIYGALLGVLMASLDRLFGATGWLVFWLFVGIQGAVAAVVVWRRTSLPYMTAAMVVGSLTSFGCAWWAAQGVLLQDRVFHDPVLVLGLAFLPAGLMFSEAWFNKDKWQQMKRHSERATLRDMLMFRHIPDLKR